MVREGFRPAVECLSDLRGCPNQNVGVPDRRHAKLRIVPDFDPCVPDLILDRRQPGLFGQAEKRPFHRIPLVANRDVGEAGREQIGLVVAARCRPADHLRPTIRAVVESELSWNRICD